MKAEDFRRFCADYDVAVALLSRDRAKVLAKYSDQLMSEYTLFYCGAGYDEHDYDCVERVEVPRSIEGRPCVANHVLRTLPNNVVILVNDDIKAIHWLGADKAHYLDKAGVRLMLMNLVVNALDVGAGTFGINEVDIRKASPLAPFHTRSMIQGCLVGVIGRGIWHDERQRIKADYDFTLQHLKRDRLVWKDLRYFLFQDLNKLPGGNMPFRSFEREEAEVENLRRWWGDDMITWKPSGGKGQGNKSLKIHV